MISKLNGTRWLAAACGTALAIGCHAGTALGLEIITVRSGQSGGVPGIAGAADDTVRFNPWGNPSGVGVSAAAFTATDFAATASGAAARVVNPQGAWMGGAVAPLSDPLARWINYAESGGYGPSGSVLYAVPFWINTTSITSATLTMEGGVDDVLGDWYSGGPNPDGLYVNGFLTGYQYQGFNFAYATTHTQSITTMVSPGLNYLYFYQRDIGYGAGGIIFSATIEVVPSPGTTGLLALAGLAAGRRRR
ncbi:MAG: hypothetical protein KF838_15535 [Phycisphaeraceae bacterium]|nr:MAG: hypothetical protein KF838_15535 [Phycisphaeraceae bacterium]